MNNSPTRSTLAEMVVVIAMAGILAAILLPVFAETQDDADRAKCLVNVKLIALVVTMYTEDWDGYFPLATGEYDVNPSPEPHIGTALLPYLENDRECFRCPTDHVDRGNPDWHPCTYGFGRIDGPDACVYGYLQTYKRKTLKIIRDAPTSRVIKSRNIQDIKNPVSFIITTELEDAEINLRPDRFLVEGPGYVTHGCIDIGVVGDDYPDSPQLVSTYVFRHGDYSNMAFADGHVKTVSIQLPCTAVKQRAPGHPAVCMELADKYTLLLDGP